MKIYEAMYCSCIYESAYATLSIHRTKEGAERAIAFSKKKYMDEWDELYKDTNPPKGISWSTGKDWFVSETELQD